MNKSILEAIHESANDLKDAGILDPMTMREFDALCLPPVRELTPAQIKRLRIQTRTSQGVFAAYLNTSKDTVQSWEQGKKRPSGAALKLINLVADKGIEVLA